jgi:hypothetical protein
MAHQKYDLVKANRFTTHAQRDLAQRQAAKARYNALRKLLPKKLRDREVRKNQLANRQSLMFASVEEQGMGQILGIGAAAAGIALVPRVARTIKGACSKVGNLLDGAHDASSNVNALIEEVLRLFRTVTDTAKAIVGKLWVLPLGVLGYWLVNRFYGNTAAMIVLTGALAVIFGKDLWSKVSSYFSRSAQSVDEQAGMTTNFKSIIVGLMCFSFLPKDAGKLMTTLMSRVSLIPRLRDGIDGLFEVACTLAESVVNLIHRIAGVKDSKGRTKEAFFGDETTKHVKKWLSDSYKHMENLIGTPTPKLVKDAHAHIRLGYATLQVLKDTSLTNILKRGIDNLEVKVAPFMGVVTAGKNFRPEPHFVLFSGKSGVGKSSILIKFVVSVLLLSGLCDPEEVLSNLWQKGSSEYWNGYVNQLCVVMDDVFQKISAKGDTDSDYMDIIRMISNWSYPLNMADLNSKGKFYFDSPLVVGTTNASNVNDTTYKEAVASSDAVVRRIHDVIYIRAASGYRVEGGFMDYEKLELTFRAGLAALKDKPNRTPEDIVNAIPWDAWEADRANFQNYTFPADDAELKSKLSIKDLVFQVAARLKKKQEYHSESLASLEDFATLLGSAKVQEQSGLDEFLKGYDSFISEFDPDLEERKMRALARNFANKKAEWLKIFNMKSLDYENSSFENMYRIKVMQLIKRLDPETDLKSTTLECQSLLNKWKELFAKETDEEYPGIYANFFSAEHISYKGVRDRALFVIGFLTDYDRARELGLNLSQVVAIYSWFKSFVVDFEDLAMMNESLVNNLRERFNIVNLAKAYIKNLYNCLKKLNVDGLSNHVCCALTFSAVVILLVQAVYKIVKVVITAVCSLLGIAPREVPSSMEVKVEDTPVAEQGNHVAVLQDESVYNKIYANSYTLFLPRVEKVLGHILFVTSNLAIMPSHFIRQVNDNLEVGILCEEDTIVCYNGAMKYSKITMTIKQFLSVPRYKDENKITDAMFISFPTDSNFMGKANIATHFVHEADFVAIGRGVLPVRLDLTRLHSDKGTVKLQRTLMSAPLVKKEYGLPIGPITPDFVWSAGMTTRVGDCGAPLMVARRSSCPKGKCIIGVHVAGNTCPVEPKACSIPVSAEMVQRAIEHFGTITDNFEKDLADKGITLSEPTVEEQAGIYNSGLVDGSFELIGLVDKAVCVAPKSRFAHTPLHKDEPFGPSGLKIAHLKPVMVGDELKYPMVEGIKNYQSPLEWRHIPDIDHIVAIATQRFVEASVHDSRDILSFEEAVKSPELMKLKAINRATSPGYPFVLDGEPGKTKWFGKDGDYDLTSAACEELWQRCEHIRQEAEKGIRLSHICIDFLKDETRPAAKVDACATRVISASPQDYVIVFRQYFGAFMAAMFRNHTRSGFTPGINPYQEWWMLANELKAPGDNHFDGDFSRFDASEQPYILWAILRFINGWYNDGPKNALVRKVLFMDLVHSRHLTSQFGPLKYVVQWNKSLPSGHALTTPVNSLYAMISLVLCYARLVGDPSNFWEKCYAATNGDDNIVTTSDDVKDHFNQVTVAHAMKEHLGLVYTSGAKDGVLKPFKPFEELTFLKRSFRRDATNQFAKGGWLAPLDFQSFLFSAYFTRAKANVGADIASNLEFALSELCMYPEEEWDRIAPKIHACMSRFGFAPKYGYTRAAYMQFMSRKTDFWY